MIDDKQTTPTPDYESYMKEKMPVEFSKEFIDTLTQILFDET